MNSTSDIELQKKRTEFFWGDSEIKQGGKEGGEKKQSEKEGDQGVNSEAPEILRRRRFCPWLSNKFRDEKEKSEKEAKTNPLPDPTQTEMRLVNDLAKQYREISKIE